MILSAHAPVNLTRAEVFQLKAAVAFWIGLNQSSIGADVLIPARDLSRRLDVVLKDLAGKPPALTWRLENIEARTLAIIRSALAQTAGTTNLQQKFA